MSQAELIFRGLDATECTSFIREVHKGAHEAGRLRDNAWMADIAMVAFDGDALIWFDEQAPETQADWALLRRAIIQRYNHSHFDPVPPAAIMNPIVMPIAPNPPATVPVADNTLSISSISLRSYERLRPYCQSDTPVFNIKVIAPKVSYTGYVSLVFDDSEFGGRCCTLTEDKSVAFECLQPLRQSQRISSNGWTTEVQIRQANSTENANTPLPTLKLFRTRDDWLSSVLTVAIPIVGGSDSDLVTIREDKQPLKDWESLRGSWEWNERTGRLTILCGPLIMLGKNRLGELTLFFWNHRVWEDDDDANAAELYLVRAN